MSNCSIWFYNTTFSNNKAILKGGAYFYPRFWPLFSNVTFTNNTAQYGSNIASYPIKAMINSTLSNKVVLDNAASGQIYRSPFNVSLLDYDDQVLNLDSSSVVSIIPLDLKTTSLKVL